MGFMEHLVSRSAHNTNRKKLTKTTVFLYLCYIRAALNYAVRENVIPKNPFVTSANTDEEGFALLKKFGLPFKHEK